jgi:hypothetical protein
LHAIGDTDHTLIVIANIGAAATIVFFTRGSGLSKAERPASILTTTIWIAGRIVAVATAALSVA